MDEELKSLQPKFSFRARSCKNPITKEKLIALSKLEYKIYGICEHKTERNRPIVSIILLLYDGNISYIKESINSILEQSYTKIEFLLIDHGTSGEVKSLIENIFSNNKNIVLIRVKEHKYDLNSDNPVENIARLWDAALFRSKGDYIYFMSYDDKISEDYAERMVSLFIKNKHCVSASPRVVSINENSKININYTKLLDEENTRGEYTDGIALAEDAMKHGKLINSPGGILMQKSELLINIGGYDANNDFTQIFRLAINGESGYDPKSTLYWRHHLKQANKIHSKHACIYYQAIVSHLEKYNMYSYHKELVGDIFADKYISFVNNKAKSSVFTCIKKATYNSTISGIVALKKVYIQCPKYIFIKSLGLYLYILIIRLTGSVKRLLIK